MKATTWTAATALLGGLGVGLVPAGVDAGLNNCRDVDRVDFL